MFSSENRGGWKVYGAVNEPTNKSLNEVWSLEIEGIACDPESRFDVAWRFGRPDAEDVRGPEFWIDVKLEEFIKNSRLLA